MPGSEHSTRNKRARERERTRESEIGPCDSKKRKKKMFFVFFLSFSFLFLIHNGSRGAWHLLVSSLRFFCVAASCYCCFLNLRKDLQK